MKTLVIKGLEYLKFEKIRDILVKSISFAVNCQYSKGLKWGIFHFQDSFYIPNVLWHCSLDIKGNAELVMKMNRELTEMLQNE